MCSHRRTEDDGQRQPDRGRHTIIMATMQYQPPIHVPPKSGGSSRHSCWSSLRHDSWHGWTLASTDRLPTLTNGRGVVISSLLSPPVSWALFSLRKTVLARRVGIFFA